MLEMNNFIMFFVVSALYCDVSGQQTICVPANGKRRKCTPFYQCEELYAIYKNLSRSQEDTNLLQSSYCGFIGRTAAVCCPVTSGATCYTPEGESGECVGLKSCRNLQKLLLPPVENTKIQYLKRSRCYGVDQYSVCCGAVPDFEPVEKGGCEDKLSALPPDPATQCCGVDNVINNKILGGNETTIDQYPWTVLIDYDTNSTVKAYCTGALISNRYVLTVGYCVAGPIMDVGSPQVIRLGEYNTTNEGPDCSPVETGGMDCTDGAIRIPIDEMIVHPEFNPLLRTNDIALIRMASEAPFTDFIRPICLPWTNITKTTTPVKLTLAGWGKNENYKFSSTKLHVHLPFIDRELCQRAYQAPTLRVNILKSHVCAGGEAAKDACVGDNGAPLMYVNNGIYELVGLVSFGPNPCGKKFIPGIYTNVYEYIPWIRSNIRPSN